MSTNTTKPIVAEETDEEANWLKGIPGGVTTELPLLPIRPHALADLLKQGLPTAPFRFTDDSGRQLALNTRRPDDRISVAHQPNGRILLYYKAAEIIGEEKGRLVLDEDSLPNGAVMILELADYDGNTGPTLYLYDPRAWAFADGVLAYLAENFQAQAAVIERRRAAVKELVQPTTPDAQAKPGRPLLDHDELIYRLTAAQEAEEMKARDRRMTWKEIAKKIRWRHGSNRAGIKLLEDARQRLARYQGSDPEHVLDEVAKWREKNKT